MSNDQMNCNEMFCTVLVFSLKYKSCRLSRKSYKLSCITLSRHSSKELAGNKHDFVAFGVRCSLMSSASSLCKQLIVLMKTK